MELYSEVVQRFKEWLGPQDAQNWTHIKINKEMQRLKIIKGKYGSKGNVYIGNVNFNTPVAHSGVSLICGKLGRLMEDYHKEDPT